MTREPDFYKKLYQTKFRGENTQNYQIFGVKIGNSKMTKKLNFHLEAPLIQYHQRTSNSCCLSSLVSYFRCIVYNGNVSAIGNHIE